MKKLLVCLLVIFLCGCGTETVFETVEDGGGLPSVALAQQLQLTFPKDAAIETMDSIAGSCYICDAYTVCVQTLDGGNLDGTIRQLTGLSKDSLTVMSTCYDNFDRYDTVWTSVSDSGEQTGRLLILDDGKYHYAVTVMADAESAGSLTGEWNELLNSVRLVSTD